MLIGQTSNASIEDFTSIASMSRADIVSDPTGRGVRLRNGRLSIAYAAPDGSHMSRQVGSTCSSGPPHVHVQAKSILVRMCKSGEEP